MKSQECLFIPFGELWLIGSSLENSDEGLALAREIVGRHNGLIEYQNRPEPEHGATFSIWLAAIGNDA